MRLRFVLSSVLALVAILATGCGSDGSDSGDAAPEAGPEHAAWSYEGETGPEHWDEVDEEYALCEQGHNQSPVNLANATRSPFPGIVTDYQPEKLEVEDDGHAIEAWVDQPDSSITIDGTRYELERFHFHLPSEELIQGRRFPASVHMVHVSDKDRIAVVAIMVKPGKPNPALSFGIPDSPGEKIETDIEIDPDRLFPKDKTAYRYEGSLTTPPCTEGVTWTVFKQPITMSADKLNAIRSVHHGNARPVQPIEQHRILVGPGLAR